MPSVKIITLGCAKNEVDSEEIAGVLAQEGYQLSANGDSTDAIVINTCGFLDSAKKEGFEVIRQALATKKKGCKVIVAGCLVQRMGAEIAKELPGVDAFVGVGQMGRFGEVMSQTLASKSQLFDVRPPHHRWADVGTRARAGQSWSAYLKISEGCDHKCAFCTIPSFRGRHVSKPIERILDEARDLAGRGAVELNLIAQDSTQYGYDLYKKFMLPDLLRKLNEIDGIAWLRLFYCYPSRVTDELIETLATLPKALPYIDVPLQHADRDALRAMKRPGSAETYLRMIEKLRSAMPDVAIRTTFIVGYPGETDQQFENLLAFVKEAQFDRLGAFLYSKESGTPAAEAQNQVPARIKRERFDRLMRLQQPISLRRNQTWVGRTLEAIVEGRNGQYAIARTFRDAPEIDGQLFIKGNLEPGQMVGAKVTRADVYDLFSEND